MRFCLVHPSPFCCGLPSNAQVVQNEVTATVKTPPSVLHTMRKALAATYL